MQVTDWFNPQDKTHIEAWSHLTQKGVWPEDFIPDDVEFPYMWHYIISGVMANLWVESILNKKKKAR